MRSMSCRLPGLALVLASVAAAGCTASASQVAPPRYDPYFPTGLAVSADERWLFVANANADLRYDSGTIQVIDLDALAAFDTSGCPAEPLRPAVRRCPTSVGGQPAAFMLPNGSVKTGNFASAIGLEELADGRLRVFASVRGDPSLTFADFDPATGTLSCGGSGTFPRCDDLHRLDELFNDASAGFFTDEPFYLAVDSEAERVFVTHLTTGVVSLARAPRDGSGPVLVDEYSDLWRPTATGAVSSVGVAVRKPGDRDGFVYITSRSEARIATVRAVPGPAGPDGKPTELIVRGPSFFYGAFLGLEGIAGGAEGDSRGIAFSSDGDRAYVVSRKPPAVLVVDTSIGPTGVPVNEVLGAVEICQQPAAIAVADGIAFTPCFSTGQVWAVDVERLTLAATIDVGRGPTGIALATGRKRAYVANYADDTIAVIDIDPASPTRYRPLFRVGRPRQPEDSL